MKILFCSKNALDVRLGAGKHLLELAQELERQGHECTVVSDEDVCPGVAKLRRRRKWDAYAAALREFLLREAAAYDAVDYDNHSLPFPRAEFPRSTLFVARSVLLVHHFEHLRLPRPRTFRALAGSVVKARERRSYQRYRLASAERTCREADLLNVLNRDDLQELVRYGHDPAWIVVVPIGLTEERYAELGAADTGLPSTPRVAYVGTFDARKGAVELPRIVRDVAAAVPGVRFRLLGSLYLGEREVLGSFPPAIRPLVEVVPRYEPAELPALLAGCSAGIFPSHVEGFGFGVLEMLAAGLPVVGYSVPGVRESLPEELLVPRGDAGALAGKVVQLLDDETLLRERRAWAKRRAGEFLWPRAARLTAEAYSAALTRLRAA